MFQQTKSIEFSAKNINDAFKKTFFRPVFTIARALMTKAQVIRARSRETSVFFDSYVVIKSNKRNKTQTTVTNICLNCITFINLTFRMLQHTSSEVIIVHLHINLNFKKNNNCTDWELTKLIDIKRQEYANNTDEVSHCQRFHLRLALDLGSTKTL